MSMFISGSSTSTGSFHELHIKDRIGIGTTSPGTKLHINGGDWNTSLRIQGSGGASGINFMDSDGNTDGSVYAISSMIGFIDPTGNWMIKAVYNDRITFATTNATELMRLDSSGRLGIGTSSPTRALTISGSDFSSTSINLRRSDSGTHNDSAVVFNAESTAASGVALGGFWFQNAVDDTTNAIFRVRTDNNAGTSGRFEFVTGTELNNNSTPSMVIKGGGNVGIGTTSPVGKLDIVGDQTLHLTNTTSDDTNKNPVITSYQYDSGTETEGFMLMQGFSNSSLNRVDIGGGNSQHNATEVIRFFTAANPTTATGTERMQIDNSGRVGIGTTPKEWTVFTPLQISYAAVFSGRGSTNQTDVANNWYYNGAERRINSGYVARYTQTSAGEHMFYTAGTDDADSTITFGTAKLSIANSGAVSTAGNLTVGGTLTTPGYSNIDTAISNLTSGGISKSGTPVDNQVAVFTGANQVEGSSNLTFASNVLAVGGNITATDITATGTITAQEFNVQFVSSSILFSTGSNIFGDSTSDTHTFTGNVNISGSSTSSLFTVDGTQGRLFGVTDELSGSLFSANTIAGLPVIEAFSDNKVTLGPYSNPVTVTSAGKVGIGTSSPGNPLVVESADDATIRVKDTSSSIRTFLQATDSDSRVGGNDNNPFRIYANGTEYITILADGKVGIGDATPSYKLDVAGTGRFTDTLTLNGGSGTLNGDGANLGGVIDLEIGSQTANQGSRIKLNAGNSVGEFIIQARQASGYSDGNIGIYRRSGTTAYSTIMHIGGDGKVAIGTQSPDGDLHIQPNSAGSVTAAGEANNLVIEDSATPGMSILFPNNSKGAIMFGCPADNDQFTIVADTNNGAYSFSARHASHYMGFNVGGTQNLKLSGGSGVEKAQFTGDVGIGISPVASQKLQVKTASDINFSVSAVGSALRINAVNDAADATVPLEMNASNTKFLSSVGIGTSPSAPIDVSTSGGSGTAMILRNTSTIAMAINANADGSFRMFDYVNGGYNGSIASVSGRIGIGTANPERALTVATSSGQMANFTNGSTDFVIYQDNSNSQIANSTSLTEQKLNMSIAQKEFEFYNDGVVAAVITGSGEQSALIINPGDAHPGVGSGQHGLYVHKDLGDARVSIDASASGDAQLRFLNAGTGTHTIYSDGSDTNDPLRFYDTALGGIAMSLDAGKLGIGVTNPGSRLQLKSTGSTTTQFTVQASGNTNNIVEIGQGDDGNAAGMIRLNNNLGALRVQINGHGPSYIFNDLAIGHTNPQVKLDVVNDDGEMSHFGQGSTTNGKFSGISLGYRESNLNYRKAAIVQEQIGDSAARGHLHFLVDTASDGGSAVIADSKMMIHGTSGNVGIGTTSPTGGKLHVAGTGFFGGNLQLNADLRLYNGTAIRFHGNGVVGSDGVTQTFGSTAGTVNTHFAVGGISAAMVISGSTGNVGIGTTNPDTLLHLEKADAQPVLLISRVESNFDPGIVDNDVVGEIQFAGREGAANTPNVIAKILGVADETFGSTSGKGELQFQTGDESAVSTKMTILGSANGQNHVGIGTTAPITSGMRSSLHVYGNHYSLNTSLKVESDGATASALIQIDSAADRDSAVYFQENGSNKARIYNDSSADALVLSDGAFTDTLHIHDGKVGIGETSPDEALHITSTAASATPVILLENSNENNLAPQINLYKNSASPADGDYAGQIDFEGKDSAGNRTEYGRIITEQYRVLSGAEDGIMDLKVAVDGTLANGIRIRGGNGARVGIGSGATNPSEALEVNGSGANLKVVSDNNVYLSLDTTQTNGDEWQIFNANSGATSTLQFKNIDQSAVVMLLEETGNVGIGVTNPSDYNEYGHKLVVKDSPNAGISIISDTDGDGSLYFGDGTGAATYRGWLGYNHANDSFSLGTAATERIRINNLGNVGIGTTSPAMPLHIVNTSGGRMMLHRSVGDNTSLLGSIMFGANDADTNLAMIASYHDGAKDSANIVFETEATGGSMAERMRISSAGNVGIGTSSPDYTLEVEKSVTGDWLSRIYNTATTSNPSGLLVRVDDADSTGILFGANASGTYRFVVKPDGKVGIGTSSPDSMLHIESSVDYNPEVIIENTNANSRSPFLSFKKTSASPAANDNIGRIQFYGRDATSSSRLMAYIEAYTPDVSSYDGAIRFNTMVNTTQTETMVITNGNVGINNSSPSRKLDVNGTGRFAGAVDFNQNVHIASGYNLYLDGGSNTYIKENGSDTMSFFTGGTEAARMLVGGQFHAANDVIAYSTTISDEKLKDDVKTIDSALDKVKKLRGVEYTWNKGSRKGQKDIGVIAQETEKVIPEIVREHEMPLIDGEVYKTVDYEKLTAVLIESVKEQQKQIEELKSEIQELKDGSSK